MSAFSVFEYVCVFLKMFQSLRVEEIGSHWISYVHTLV